MPSPVVLLHSSLASGGQWRTLAARLGERPYRVFAPDLIGYGTAAPWSGEGRFQLHHEARAIHALLDGFGEPAHLIGHSYGGAVALEVARRRSDLRTLTLIEPVAFHLLRDGDVEDTLALAEIRRVAQRLAQALATGDYAVACGEFVDYWSGRGTWAAMGAAKRAGAAARAAKVALDFHATLEHAARLGDLEELALPTLLMHGERTTAPARRICEHLARVLPDAREHVISGAGHMAPLTHADEVNEFIVRHLEAGPTRRITHPERSPSWIPQS